jgi:hypothetical protein
MCSDKNNELNISNRESNRDIEPLWKPILLNMSPLHAVALVGVKPDQTIVSLSKSALDYYSVDTANLQLVNVTALSLEHNC